MEKQMNEIKELMKKENLTEEEKDYIVDFFLDNVEDADIKTFECWENLRYESPNSNSHKGYYTYQETWLCVDGYQVLLLNSTYSPRQD
jgi:hypothetical protein